MPTFTTRSFVYAANTTIAALIALSVALAFDLPNPWWAALTVFITSQPLAAAAGAVVARARYRIAGTVIGMSASLVIVPALASSPELLVLGLGAWLGLCVYLALLDRGPRTYTFLLAGYTVALVALPQAGDPGVLFDSALARTEEILLGTTCAAVVHNLLLPQELRGLVAAKVAASLADVRRWCDRLARPVSDPAERQARTRYAIDLSELRTLAANLRFEPGMTANEMRIVVALEDRLVALLPLLTAIEDRLAGIASQRDSLAALFLHVERVREWITADKPGRLEALAGIREEASGLFPLPGALDPDTELLATSACQLLVKFVAAWEACLLLADALRDPKASLPSNVQRLLTQETTRPLHVDHGLAALAGLSAAVAVIVTGAVCWLTGWQQGAGAIGLTAANSAVFAFLDDPRPLQRLLPAWSAAAVPAGGLYLFAILPAVDGLPMLCLALLPFFFGTALFLGTPKYTLHGLSFALISQSIIALQPAARADFGAFTTLAIGTVLGTMIAFVVTGLLRVISAEWSSRRLLGAGWRELAGLADGTIRQTTSAWASRMLDRVGLLLPRLARVAGDDPLRLGDALRDLQLGVGVTELREVGRAAGCGVAAAVDVALRGLADHARRQMRRGPAVPDRPLFEALDRVAAQLFTVAPGEPRARGLAAVAGLRRNLFPDAPPYAAPAESAHAC